MRAVGFSPVYGENSRILILGSFPSVKSREISFYYGNPQNRFWKTVCGFFGEEAPPTAEGKRDFLLRRGIALWDVVTECEIDGSKDASIKNEKIADVAGLLKKCPIGKIYCNGTKSYALLTAYFPQLAKIAEKLPSTSPANPRFSEAPWRKALEVLL